MPPGTTRVNGMKGGGSGIIRLVLQKLQALLEWKPPRAVHTYCEQDSLRKNYLALAKPTSQKETPTLPTWVPSCSVSSFTDASGRAVTQGG